MAQHSSRTVSAVLPEDPVFGAHHPHGDSQPSLSPIAGDLIT